VPTFVDFLQDSTWLQGGLGRAEFVPFWLSSVVGVGGGWRRGLA
jgi:hypothetical protein